MKWKQHTAAELGSNAGVSCHICHKLITDVVFAPEDFDELQCLLLEKDSGLGVKLNEVQSPKEFWVCTDCKIKVDEDLKADSVHIMYCE